MKTPINLFLILLLIGLNSCSKQDECDNPVDCLPPATHIGANTAGCLVNGEVLVPTGGGFNRPTVLLSQYVFHNGRYIFSISIVDLKSKIDRSIHLESKKNKLINGETYTLSKSTEDSSSAFYFLEGGFVDAFETTDEIIGEFKVTHLDEYKNIISGTFWFDAINNEGEIVQIREGRFDVRY
ncbi:DUF6252 family protein [Gillisia sp. Q332]|mgnify:CR=1 FL=1|uniref:DUF6252 family protein n=1 Tax=Gillisia xinjiangensis TaxID=3384765 RepID=UPI00391DB88D